MSKYGSTMDRRKFLVTLGLTAGGTTLAFDRFWPDYPEPSTDDVSIIDMDFTVETPPETEREGFGYAYVQIQNDIDYPIRATVTLELLQDGNPYTYDYSHNEVVAEIQPGEERVLTETWEINHFPASVDATSVEIANLELEHVDEGIIQPSEGEQE